jgi:tRNA A-37 threonylcarbamoyl transferase component Bud32
MTDPEDGRSPAAAADLGATALSAGTPAPQKIEGAAAEGAGPIGRVLKGRYKIKRLLGEGGMGGVYEGEHLEIGKRVAIKIVHKLHARDTHIAARIKQEARSTSAIESEHIVQVFDAGEDDELGLFLVMELLKGEDLNNLLARRKRLTPASTAALVVQAAQGLARAHAAGIVHRDLKPANVFVCARDDGSSLVKLVDFGIAKIVRDAQSGSTGPGGGLTRLGMVIGTPQYMSPEQAQGLPTVDLRTDVYSLGAVLFECIVGTSPFPEMPTYEQTILQIMMRPAPRLRDLVPTIDPALDALCAEMMAMDPAARPQDMGAVRERLIRIFPEIETSRAPMRSITAEMGLEVTAFDAGMTGDRVQALVEEARRATAAGPAGTGVRRPGTHSAVALDSHPDTEEAAPQVAGLPRRARKTPWVLAASAVALIGVVAVVGLTRGDRHADAPAAAGAGLVQSTAAPIAPLPASPASPASSVSSAAPAAQVSAAVVATPPATTTPARTTTPSTPPGAAHPARAAASHARASARTPEITAGPVAPSAAPAASPPPPRAAEEVPAARPVGGTGVANEF